jgi:hypothetical protein
VVGAEYGQIHCPASDVVGAEYGQIHCPANVVVGAVESEAEYGQIHWPCGAAEAVATSECGPVKAPCGAVAAEAPPKPNSMALAVNSAPNAATLPIRECFLG